jgi:hypothetical protein
MMDNPSSNWQPMTFDLDGSTWTRTLHIIPAITIDETRTVAGETIAGGHLANGVSPVWDILGPERYAHASAHVNPHAQPRHTPIPTRQTPTDQPHFFRTIDHDWDFWEKHRDLVFERHGLDLDADPWEQVYRLGEDIWRWRFDIRAPGGRPTSGGRWVPMSHPTPSLIYGSWCAGCSPALMALCATLGIRSRNVQVLDHAMTEVWLGDRWCLVDNSTNMLNDACDNEMMSPAGLHDVLLDPMAPERNFTNAQRCKFWQRTAMMYKPNTGLWGEEPENADLTPANAVALYPQWQRPLFKSADPHRYLLLACRNHFSIDAMTLRPGMAFGRTFWLGDLDDTQSMTVTFLGPRSEAEGASPDFPDDGKGFALRVNDTEYPLSETNGWTFAAPATGKLTWGVWPECVAAWGLQMDLPLDALAGHAWNRVSLVCSAQGDCGAFLRFGGGFDMIDADAAVVCRE